MALEYIDEILQLDYTLAGVTDENYPSFSFDTVYPKNTKVIYSNKIYESLTIIKRTTWYVYSREDDTLYVPSENTFISTATFDPSKEFEQRYIYLEATDILYKYIGATTITINPLTENFADTSKWQNLGIQLNGYSSFRLTPDNYPLAWNDLGFVNSQRAFDNSTPSQTIADGETMVYVFNTGKVERIALFDLDATSITVKTHLTSDAESEFNTRTDNYPIFTRRGLHFYEILTAEITLKKTLYIQVPTASVQEITLTITRESGQAKVGDITLGKARQIGVVLDGVNFDVKEYSTYSSDSEATDRYVEGGYRNVNSFTVSFPTNSMESVKNQLDERRGKITVYNMNPKSQEDFLKVKGFIRSRPIDYMSNSTKSKINIKVEGRIR